MPIMHNYDKANKPPVNFRAVMYKRVLKLKPFKIAALDIETYGKENKFLMGSVYSDLGVFTTWKQHELIDYLLSNRLKGYMIFATNLEFDIFALFPKHVYDFKHFKLNYRKSRLISVKAGFRYEKENGGYKWAKVRLFLDTMNYHQAGVAKLGVILGLPKLPQPACFLRKPKNKAEAAEMEAYNIRDTEISYKFALWLNTMLNGLNIKLCQTIAASSLWGWRANYQDRDLYQPTIPIMENLLQAYYGGRTEVFKRGKLPKGAVYRLYDINSMYAKAMLNRFPDTKSLFVSKQPTLAQIAKYEGVVKCRIETPTAMYYPLLPKRHHNKLIFPLGAWQGWYSVPELRRALKLGYKITPLFAYFYNRTYRPFASFVKFFYDKRLTDKKNSLVYKIISNALYGKFAQKWDTETEYTMLDDLPRLPAGFVKAIGDYAIIEKPGKPAEFVNPIFSIYTTAYARLMLYDYLTKYEAVYCDTDSIITRKRVRTGKLLGQMKLEKTIKEGWIIKPKLYYLSPTEGADYIRAKGLRLKSKQEFFMLLHDRQSSYTKITKFKQSIRQSNKRRAVLSSYTEIKKLKLDDNKRDWAQPLDFVNFGDSKPLKVWE